MLNRKSFLQRVLAGQPTSGQQNIVIHHSAFTPKTRPAMAAMTIKFADLGWNIHVLFETPNQAAVFPSCGVCHSHLFPGTDSGVAADGLVKIELESDIFLNTPSFCPVEPKRIIHWGVPPDIDGLEQAISEQMGSRKKLARSQQPNGLAPVLESIGQTRKKPRQKPSLNDLAQRSAVKGQRDF
jgi:hypothetical protein